MHGNQTSNADGHLGTDGNGREQRARKNTTLLVRRAREVGQINIAAYAGVSDTTVSRWFAENAEAIGKALAFMGLKVLPEAAACVRSKKELDHLIHYAQIGMASVRSADDLLFEEQE